MTSPNGQPGRADRGPPAPPPEPFFGARAITAFDDWQRRSAERPGISRGLVHLAHLSVLGIRRSQLTRMAAALSYRTVFGLIPVLVIGIVVLAAFASEDEIRQKVAQLVVFVGFDKVAVAEARQLHPADVPGLNPFALAWGHSGVAEAPLAAALDGAETLASGEMGPPRPDAPVVAESAQRLDEWINSLVTRIRGIPYNTIGIIGVLTLVYAALSMLVEIEKAFNQICNAPTGRSWARRVTQYWTLLTLGTLLLVASFGVTEGANEYVRSITLFEGHSRVQGLLVLGVSKLLAVVISTALLVIVYTVVPNSRVQFLPALVGAFVAAVLWEAGKFGFTNYIRFSTGTSKLYGTIALVPLFLLWVYVTWVIVLLGLQLTAAMQTYRLAAADGLNLSVLSSLGLVKEAAEPRKSRIIDPAATLVVLSVAAERFSRGLVTDHSDVAQETGLDEPAMSEMLDRLAGAGYIVRVAHADREGTYTLAMPPASIRAADVIILGESMILRATGPGHQILDAMALARLEAVGTRTLADLLSAPAAAPAGINHKAALPTPIPTM